MQILGANGNLTINDHRGSMEEIEELSKYRIVSPSLTSKRRWALPGFLYQSISWAGPLSWSLRLSMWIPTFLMAIAATFFIHGYLRIRRQALKLLPSTTQQNRPSSSPKEI
jgi:hypothetical protein